MTNKELIGKIRPCLDAMERGDAVICEPRGGEGPYKIRFVRDLVLAIEQQNYLSIIPAEKPKLKKRVPLDPEDVHPGISTRGAAIRGCGESSSREYETCG